MTFLALALLSLATYRIVRLWLYDSLLDGVRDWTWERLTRPGRWRAWLLKLVTCQWCLGIHVALWFTAAWFVLVVGWDGWSSVAWFVLTWLAVAALQSWCHLVEDALAQAGE